MSNIRIILIHRLFIFVNKIGLSYSVQIYEGDYLWTFLWEGNLFFISIFYHWGILITNCISWKIYMFVQRYVLLLTTFQHLFPVWLQCTSSQISLVSTLVPPHPQFTFHIMDSMIFQKCVSCHMTPLLQVLCQLPLYTCNKIQAFSLWPAKPCLIWPLPTSLCPYLLPHTPLFPAFHFFGFAALWRQDTSSCLKDFTPSLLSACSGLSLDGCVAVSSSFRSQLKQPLQIGIPWLSA